MCPTIRLNGNAFCSRPEAKPPAPSGPAPVRRWRRRDTLITSPSPSGDAHPKGPCHQSLGADQKASASSEPPLTQEGDSSADASQPQGERGEVEIQNEDTDCHEMDLSEFEQKRLQIVIQREQDLSPARELSDGHEADIASGAIEKMLPKGQNAFCPTSEAETVAPEQPTSQENLEDLPPEEAQGESPPAEAVPGGALPHSNQKWEGHAWQSACMLLFFLGCSKSVLTARR